MSCFMLQNTTITIHFGAGGWGRHQTGWGGGYLNDVMEFDAEEERWHNIGAMSIDRASHAVSVINFNSITAYCT